MRISFLFLTLLLAEITFAQTNKPSEGDLGIRYGVAFNGTFAQTLALSGILPNHWELGAGISVSYTNTQSQSILPYNAYSNGTYIPTTQTNTTTSRSVNVAFIPYAVYHFPVKSNLDVYAGINMNVGTGAITLQRNTTNSYSGTGYYSQQISGYKYPVGYQVGGGLTIGCQYFFYKNLALGVEATLDGAYTAQKGNYNIIQQEVNSGINNVNTTNTSSNVNGSLDNHTFSFKTASSAGIYLTFYLSGKRKKTESNNAAK